MAINERCLCCGFAQHEGECPTTEQPLPVSALSNAIWHNGRTYEQEERYVESILQQWGMKSIYVGRARETD